MKSKLKLSFIFLNVLFFGILVNFAYATNENLFNKSNLTENYYINNTGTFLYSTILGHSELIEIIPKQTYSIPFVASSAGGFFDKNKTWISPINSNNAQTFITPENAKYVVLNVNITNADNVINKEKYMLLKSSCYPDEYFSYSEAVKHKKNVYSFGDSITWYDGKTYEEAHLDKGIISKGYLSYIREEFDFNVTNYGIKGGTIQKEITESIKSKDYNKVDIVTITGGVNDWYKNKPIGQIQPIGSVFDTNTTLGALQSSIEHIINSNPKIRIYLITPIRGMIKETSKNGLRGEEFPNAYSDIFINLGKLYGIPVCDIYNLSGFNKSNYAYYYKDTGVLNDRYIHIGNDGYKRMSDVLVKFLKTYE